MYNFDLTIFHKLSYKIVPYMYVSTPIKHGKVVEAVECDSFEGVHLQHYNHKRYQVQPTKDEVEQTACVEFPPWRKRGSDFIWDPEN